MMLFGIGMVVGAVVGLVAVAAWLALFPKGPNF